MKISKRCNAVEPSLIRKLFNMAKEYTDVIDLTLGDPDLSTPDNIKEAGCAAIMDNKTHYSVNAGLLETRSAVAKHIQRIWNVPCNPVDNLMLTVGGMEALYLALISSVDPGDEVIILAPYYVNYLQMVRLCGGIPRIVDSYDERYGIVVDEQKLRASITDKTVAIIINSPNNPTGSLLSKSDLKTVAQIAAEYDLMIISDEVYRTLIYDEKKHESILQFQEARDRTVLVDSMSKEYCMTGWRIGYVYAPKELIVNMVKLQENVAACASLPSQYAMLEAYGKDDTDTAYILEEFTKRRDCLCDALSKIQGLSFVKPQATFYLFLNIKETGMDCMDFAYKLLEKEHVAVVPGIAYGAEYSQYVRIAFTKDTQVILQAVKRIEHFLTL